eukprot:m.212783 g.212783  ORF g.212783 m.212783 type:complete len:578 (-) comp19051_c0_seq2:490-2223(-)
MAKKPPNHVGADHMKRRNQSHTRMLPESALRTKVNVRGSGPATQSKNRSIRALQLIFLPVTLMSFAVLVYVSWRYWPENSENEVETDASDPACQRLAQWISSLGGWVWGVRCAHIQESNGRGIVATRPLSSNTTYAVVPRRAWFWEPTIKEFSAVGRLLDMDVGVLAVCGQRWGARGEPWRLAVALDYERVQPTSYWRAYIDTMPEAPTSPVPWNEVDVYHLASPQIASKIRKRRKLLEATYTMLYTEHLFEKYPQFFNSTFFSFDSFAWAVLQIWSRAFSADLNDANGRRRSTWAMIPFIDLNNHRNNVNDSFEAFVRSDAGGVNGTENATSFRAWAPECVSPGGEIFHDYDGGGKASALMFTHYGFFPTHYWHGDWIVFLLPPSIRKNIKAAVENNWIHGFAGVDGHITEPWLTMYAKYIAKAAANDTRRSAPTRDPTMVCECACLNTVHALRPHSRHTHTSWHTHHRHTHAVASRHTHAMCHTACPNLNGNRFDCVPLGVCSRHTRWSNELHNGCTYSTCGVRGHTGMGLPSGCSEFADPGYRGASDCHGGSQQLRQHCRCGGADVAVCACDDH